MGTPTPNSLGRRVAECRERLGWTQRTLAEKTELSVTFLSEVENDRRMPGSEALLRIADSLGASLDYLVKGVIDAKAAPPPLVIPSALTALAEELHWSLSDVKDLLKFQQMVVARRSRGGRAESALSSLTAKDWRELAARFFGVDADGTARA